MSSDPKVSLDKPTDQTKAALMQAQHVSTRRHAQPQLYKARDWLREHGHDVNEFAIVVIDSDDPWMRDRDFEKLDGYGYRVEINARQKLYEALKAFEMPVETSGLTWSPSSRAWVDRDGKKATDYATRRPYMGVARNVLAPCDEHHFLVVTFTRNSVEFCDMPHEEIPLDDEAKPLVVDVPPMKPDA